MFAPWEAIFILCLLLGMVSGVWLVLRQPETLAMENKRDFTLVALWQGVKETLSHPMSRSYTICAGLVFGAFIGYLSTSQQVFQDQYGMGAKFPFFFGGLALVIGVASFVNSKLVMVFGMEELSIGAVGVMALASLGLIIANVTFSVEIDIFICTAYFSITFFGMGILFGNFNALALAPLGHMAGVANSVISSVQTLISVAIGGAIGQFYNGTTLPLVVGFFVCCSAAYVVVFLARKKQRSSGG